MTRVLAFVAGVAAMLGMLVAAGPALADGSSTVTVCGARGTFKTVNGVRQVQYIVDGAGRANSQYNGGCFGISPSGRIWWTPRSHPSWREVPGNGRARLDDRSEIACGGLQFIWVRSSSGAYWGQYWDKGKHNWNGHWSNGFACSDSATHASRVRPAAGS